MDWSKLPGDLVELISKKLNSITDYVRFRAVCKPWSSTVPAKTRYLPPQLPWLMLPSNNGDTRDLCLLPSRNIISLDLPEAQGMRCCGSSHGWMAMIGMSSAITLLNPLTRDQIQLPPLTAFPEVLEFDISRIGREYTVQENDHETRTLGSDKMRDGFLYKIVLSVSPISTVGCAIMALALRCYYPWTLAFCQVGDETWTVIRTDISNAFVDAVFFKEKVYAIEANGALAVWDGSSVNISLVPALVRTAGPPSHLMEFNGDLMDVLAQACFGMGHFEVYKLLDLSGQSNGSVLTNIGHNLTLFCDQFTCLSISDRQSHRGNCYYSVGEFYFDDSAVRLFSKKAPGKSWIRDIRVTDMGNGSVEHLPFYWEGYLDTWSSPTWSFVRHLFVDESTDSMTLVRGNLICRGVVLSDVRCPLCHLEVEDEFHILLWYPIVQHVWFGSHLAIHSGQMTCSNFVEWFLHWINLSHLKKRAKKKLYEELCILC